MPKILNLKNILKMKWEIVTAKTKYGGNSCYICNRFCLFDEGLNEIYSGA
jgi:hypothetical protein